MDAAAKQQIVERVRQANNILVTVSNNPSVDQLAACIGLTLLLNRMEKHATAVFSGQVPSTLEFLQPEKTIETNTDSLRDFIISLDKEKADKLRYKVEDQVVRIFITPYKTSLGEKDLIFSQGDFNVEVVLALGIKDRAQIDAAITAHGRILHDATVISLNAGEGKAPELGQINWQDPTASSLCEMIVSISEAFGSGLIDNQMATAFLTGIVAETSRFSNPKTSPKVMTISAQLMAAGANQQLIVSKLETVAPTPAKQPVAKAAAKATEPAPLPVDGALSIAHEEKASPKKAEPAKTEPKVATIAPTDPDEIQIDEQGNLITAGGNSSEPTKNEPSSGGAPPAAAGDTVAPSTPKEDDPPGPHSLLNPDKENPILDTPFSASTQPSAYDGIPSDPLASPAKDVGILEHTTIPTTKGDIKPPSPESARSAVEQAYAAAPFDPADHPIKALNAINVDMGTPASAPIVSPPTPRKDDGSAPPPFPPPLSPTQGVVIPSPSNGQSQTS